MFYSTECDLNMMRVRSGYFKKEYDLGKAELVGRGTFAEVFRIFDAELNDSVAIRRVRKSQGDLEDIAKEKLINEELRRVDNENILKIYDIIEQPEVVWYITEYCAGGSLWDALNLCPGNRMPDRDALLTVLQVSKGVQELHNHRITHRDLKPENILLKTKYVPGKALPVIKLADFGLSTQKIIMETIAGTKEYIAPEQAKFHNYTNAVDVWSLGIIFDEILHGTPFYSGEDNKEVFSKILKTPFRVRNDDLRPAIKDLLASLLRKKPYERPIIAVIRSTIEKILEEIDAPERTRKLSLELPTDASKTTDSKLTTNADSKLTSNGDSKIKIITTPAKDNIVFAKKPEKPAFGKEASPLSKEANMFKKPPSSDRKEEELPAKPLSPHSTREAKDPIKNLLQLPDSGLNLKRSGVKSDAGETDRSKIERRPFLKLESTAKATPAGIANIPEKISLFKAEKRKLVNSSVKREEYRSEVISVAAYATRIANDRNALLTLQLHLQNQLAFLPNTHLTAAPFENCPTPDLPVREFKRKADFLNGFSVSEDYEVRLLRGERELRGWRERAEEELLKAQEGLKEAFFSQLDSFIDHYVDKVLK